MDEFVYTPKCECCISDKEEIVVKDDENYDNLSTVYFHCPICGIDEWVIDFYTSEILHEHGA